MHRLVPNLLVALAIACTPPPSEKRQYRASAEAAAKTIASDWIWTRLQALADDAMEGRDNLTAGGKRAREHLIAEMKAMGLQPKGPQGWSQPFDQGVNLIGWIPGVDPDLAGEHVIVGAHYDHLGRADQPESRCKPSATDPTDLICNGASDNASGCAVTLAVARALLQSELGVRRSVLVVFWDAEEDGLAGSTHFVEEDPVVQLAEVAAMFSVDIVGTEIIPGAQASFALGAEHTDGLRELVHVNSTAAGLTVHPVSGFFVGPSGGGRSDHLPFSARGVPALFLSSGAPPTYHTAADEADPKVLKQDLLLAVARHTLLVTADVANRTQRPSHVATPAPHLDDARALVALGELVAADPAAVGLTDPNVVALVQSWIDRLRAYLATPPQTADEWQAYQNLVKAVVAMIHLYQ